MIRTAFVLGAGLGTRLKSLTARRPKPLIPVANRPLITYAFDHLLGIGVERLVVNTHWRSEAYARFFPEPAYRGAPLAFRDEQPEVLETAGGIWNVRDLLGPGTFLVYNGDILSDLPLDSAVRVHFDSGNEVTMVLRSSGGPLQVAFDATSGRITDIGDRVDAAAGPRFLFTGIYLVNSDFIARIPAATKISVVPIFCDMIRAGAKLGGVVIDEGHWWDLGNREHYLAVHGALATPQSAPWIDPTAEIAPTATISGATAIGPGARIGEHASVNDSLVWEGAEIASGTLLNHCIVTDGQRVEGIHSHADF
ncbi:MAG: sugar phosphate nucleotidyltransferase [Chthoniobacter sp.]|uniref:sugar phosphate nucleotidyltransferase n=1 Tax=Chthoniobacter sp. TaxID=2510640 RepID=UPI0032A65188